MNLGQRPYAVFDIDGTLIRWQLYHALADRLVKHGSIDAIAYQEVLRARRNWKNRSGTNSFDEYETAMIELVGRSLKGMDYALFNESCIEVFKRYQDQVYTFTRDLINELRLQNYLIFALSGSPTEVVSLVSNYYNFDDYAGSTYNVQDGYLDGKVKPLLGPAKLKQLIKLIKKHNASTKSSIAVGDTASDIDMLELAERAIAFNPAQNLFKKALSSGWEVVVERKNVVYQLNYKYGSYVLATPTTSESSLRRRTMEPS